MARIALIIANWKYHDPLLRGLVSPSHDAESLADILRDPSIGNFDVAVLANEPSYVICEQTESFFGDRERDDLLVYYFSGHGVTDDQGQLYYAAPNTLHNRLRSTAVAAAWVNDLMSQCRSRRQVLLLDCCHSGAFARTKAAPSVNVGKYFIGSTPEEGRGKFILTASDAFQYSFEGDAVQGAGVQSVFTEALVEGLRSGAADIDGDGQVTLDELYSFVYNRVRNRKAQQTPRKWSSDVEGNIVIANNPAPPEVPLPEELQIALDSEFSSVRERAILQLEKLLRGRHRGLALTARKALVALVNDDSRRVSSAAENCLLANNVDKLVAGADGVPVILQPAPPGHGPNLAQEKSGPIAEDSAEAETLAQERVKNKQKAKKRADAFQGSKNERAQKEFETAQNAEAQHEQREYWAAQRGDAEGQRADFEALTVAESEQRAKRIYTLILIGVVLCIVALTAIAALTK